jgi:phosphatidylethanolamine/phosphatidyl-N-methylethanolamine N-methyltransferase
VDFFLKAQKNVLFKEVNMLPEGNLLEIGVGNGTHLRKYKRHKIVGIDTSVSMLKIARKHTSPNIELVEMDGMALLYDNERFDYVVLSHVIAVVDDPEKLMEEVLRVLKPGGKVYILNHFTPNNWLRYVDKAFDVTAKVLHFKSIFHMHQIATLRKFTCLKETSLGAVSYFKLLVYQKTEK